MDYPFWVQDSHDNECVHITEAGQLWVHIPICNRDDTTPIKLGRVLKSLVDAGILISEGSGTATHDKWSRLGIFNSSITEAGKWAIVYYLDTELDFHEYRYTSEYESDEWLDIVVDEVK
jgi:hypothetical protein